MMMISRKQFPLSPTAYVETIFDSKTLEYDVSISKKMERKYSNSVQMHSEDWTKMTNNLNFFVSSAIERQTVIEKWMKRHKNQANQSFPHFEPHELRSTFSASYTMVLGYHGYRKPNNLQLVTYICPYTFAPAETQEDRSTSTRVHKPGAVVLCPQRGVKLNFEELMALHNLVDEIGSHIATYMTSPHDFTLDGSKSLIAFQTYVTAFFNNPRCQSVQISLNKPQIPEYLERYRKEEGLVDGMCCCTCEKCLAKYPCYSTCSFQLKRRHGFGHETAEFIDQDPTPSKKAPRSKVRKTTGKGPLPPKRTVKDLEDTPGVAFTSHTTADVDPITSVDSHNSASVATNIDDSAMGFQSEKEEEEEEEEEEEGGGGRGEQDEVVPVYPPVNEWIKIHAEKNKDGKARKTVDSSVNWTPTEQPPLVDDDDILMQAMKDNQIVLTSSEDEEFVATVMKPPPPTLLTPKSNLDPVLATKYPSSITEMLESAMSD